jgi:hypothetical protein
MGFSPLVVIAMRDAAWLDPAPVLHAQLTGTLPPYLSTMPVLSEVSLPVRVEGGGWGCVCVCVCVWRGVGVGGGVPRRWGWGVGAHWARVGGTQQPTPAPSVVESLQ